MTSTTAHPDVVPRRSGSQTKTPLDILRGMVFVVGNWRTIRMLREDRLLMVFTLALSAVSLIPMLATPFLPLVDLGCNVGASGLLTDVLRHRDVPARYYDINALPIPYWSGYLIMALLGLLAGPLFAAKATVALTILLLPLSHMRLLIALGRSPRLGLWAFILAWDVNTYWGWFTFQLGMALALYAIAWLVESEDFRDSLKIIPLTAVIGLTHVHATALVGICGLVLAPLKARPWRTMAVHCVGMSGFAILLPWLLHAAPPGGAASRSYAGQDVAISDKVASLYKYTVDIFPSPEGVNLTSVAFLFLLLGPVVLGAIRRRASSPRSTAMAFAVLATCCMLYFTLPFAVYAPVNHWWTYPRYGTYILLSLLLLPSPTLTGWRACVLAPGIALVVALNIARLRQFSAYGDRTRPYLDIIAALPKNSTFLPLDYAFDWSGTKEWSLGQIHGYAAAAKSSFDPHLFDHTSMPLLYRANGRLPYPDWQQTAATFSMQSQGRFYDYIITHPRSLDTVSRLMPDDVSLVREAGEWRLYAVKKH